MRAWRVAALALSIAAGSAGCALHPRRHPELKGRLASIREVGVLPPDVEAFRITFKGDQEMLYDLLPGLKQQASEELVRGLTARGYAAEPIALTDAVLAERPELKRALYTVQEIFHTRLKESKKRWYRKFAYTIGSEINPFADYADVDALVLARAQGIKKSGGQIAQDWAKTLLIAAATFGTVIIVNHPSVTLVQLAMIDGNTGEILWYHENAGFGGFDIANEQAFRNAVYGMMRAFPKVK